jgi:hypothetical protein
MGPVEIAVVTRFFGSVRTAPGRNKTLLAASIKALPYETPGWITNSEAKQLFSPMDDAHAFGEMDETGKSNINRYISM